MARPERATRRRAPGGSFIWPYTRAIFDAPELILVDDPRFGHFLVEIVAFPGALADPGEHRHAAMQLGNVVDQFHDDHGLAHTSAAKGADLSAFQKGTDQVDDLDAGGQHLRRRRLLHECRRRTVNGIVLLRLDRSAFVDRVAANIEHPPHYAFPDRHGNGRAGVDDLITAFEALGAGHGDGPDPLVAKVLLHLERQFDGLVLNLVIDGQRVVDAGQLLRKFDVHHRTDDSGQFCLCSSSHLISLLVLVNRSRVGHRQFPEVPW